MSDKSLLYILLAGFFYLPTILSEELSNDEKAKAIEKFLTTHYKDCKHTISEENYEILLDGSEIDNEEVRAYSLCTFKAFKWMVQMKIDVEGILNTTLYLIERKYTPAELIVARLILNICKKEAEIYTTEMEIMVEFYRCFINRIQSDI